LRLRDIFQRFGNRNAASRNIIHDANGRRDDAIERFERAARRAEKFSTVGSIERPTGEKLSRNERISAE
jgi:hypothetical protein